MKSIQLPNISENTPPAITAGVIYLVSYICNLDITKKEQIKEVLEEVIKRFGQLNHLINNWFSHIYLQTYYINLIILI